MLRTASRFALLAAFGLACIVAVSGCASAADAPSADAPVGAAGADIYVSPDGDDAAAGTQAAPFATLERARDVVRGLRAGDDFAGATVNVGAGVYELTKPLVLGPEDSGTDGAPVVSMV